MSKQNSLGDWRGLRKAVAVATVFVAAGSARGQFGADAPEVLSSFTELQDRADDAWAGSATVAMYPPGMSFTNALPIYAVAAGFDPAFLAGLRETQTAEGIVLRTGLVRETAGPALERQWFGAVAPALAATPLPQGYDPVAWVLARFPPPGGLSAQQLDDYIAARRLNRQTMTFTLLAEADVPAYLAARAARIAAMPSGQLGEDDLGMSGSAYDPVAKALRVLLVAPKYAGTLGVFETKDLRNPFPWALLATLPNPGGVVEFVVPDPPEQGVFRLSNLLVDSDLDGIADAVEELMLGTDAHAWDSAGDGICDWDRVFRLDGEAGAGGVPLQVTEGLGLPEQDMSKIVSGPVDVRVKGWWTVRHKRGWLGFLDERTRFLEYESRNTGIVHHCAGNTETLSVLYQMEEPGFTDAGEMDMTDFWRTPWWTWPYWERPWGPFSPGYVVTNTGVSHSDNPDLRLKLARPYTDRMLTALAAGDLSAAREPGGAVPPWGHLVFMQRPAQSVYDYLPETDEWVSRYETEFRIIPIPAYRGALDRSAFRLPEVLTKPDQPDLLGGIELQAIAWQATTEQPIPAAHLQRGIVLEVHRDPPAEGVSEYEVTRVVPREVFLKGTPTGGESVEFTVPPPQEAGSVEVRDGYVGITVNGVAEKDEETPGVFACVGDTVTFTVTGLDDRVLLTAYRLRVTGPGGVAVAVTPSPGGAPIATPMGLTTIYFGDDAQSFSFPAATGGPYEIVTEVLARADASEPEWLLCDRVLVGAGELAMAVDGNRDGELSFTAPEDQSCLFWLNDDHDVRYLKEELNEPDIIAEDDLSPAASQVSATVEGVNIPPNCLDDTIGAYVNYAWRDSGSPEGGFYKQWSIQEPSSSMRDLEDFTRLHIRVSPALAADPTVSFWLQFDQVTEGFPMINLFEAVDETADYLSLSNVAMDQVSKTKLCPVGPNLEELNRSKIKPNGQVSPFLFEGMGAGKGRLYLVAKRGHQLLAETSVAIELKPADWFYDRYAVHVTSPEGTDPWNVALGQEALHEHTAGYAAASDEVFLLVHGWNMSEFEKHRWAETAFKRLWWQGYRGRMVLFEWPTLELPDFFDVGGLLEPRNFDNSEFRAWRSAPALADLFQTLGPARLRVMAHSMGNVVTAEALKLHTGPPVHSYIACQAALSAQYFDNTVAALFPCPTHDIFGVEIGGIHTPDVMGHFMTGDTNSSEYFQSIETKVVNVINYYNPSDWALHKWQINNVYRPADYGGYAFGYTGATGSYNPTPPGDGDPRIVEDRFFRMIFTPTIYRLDQGDQRHVIFSYIAESRSVALGSTFPGRGFDRSWGLNNHYGYDAQHYSHSRQFRSNVVDEYLLWKKVVEDFLFTTTIHGEGATP